MSAQKYDSSLEAETNHHQSPERTCYEISESANTATISCLPTEVLEQIFSYMAPLDLFHLAVLSRELRWIVAKRIYTCIILLDEFPPFWKGHDGHQRVYRGTVVMDKRLPVFMRTVKSNPRLAAFVTTFILSAVHEFQLKTCLELMSYLPNLVEWHDQSGLSFKEKFVSRLQIVSCDESSVPVGARNLIELKIKDYEISANASRMLAYDLACLGAYTKLRKLHFVHTSLAHRKFDPVNPNRPHDASPQWVEFLENFSAAGVTLNLISFEIYGKFWERNSRVLLLISKTINLKELKKLILHLDEYRHASERRSVPIVYDGVCFIEMITARTPKLESLAAYDTYADYSVQMAAIEKALKYNIPNQLKELFILISALQEIAKILRMQILELVAKSQRNLAKLKYEDGYGISGNYNKSEVISLHQQQHMLNDIYHEYLRQELFPVLLPNPHARPVLSKKHEEFISNSLKYFYDWLMGIGFEKLIAENLPFLEQLYIGSIYLDMKRQGIYLNDRTVTFSSIVEPGSSSTEPSASIENLETSTV